MSKKNRRVRLTHYDSLFRRSPNPVYINDMYLDEPGQNIIEQLFQKSEGSLDFSPRCECGYYSGKVYEGHVCPLCGELITSDFINNFRPKNWMRIDHQFAPILHPRFYMLMANLVGRIQIGKKGNSTLGRRQRVPVIDFVLNPDLELPDDLRAGGIEGQGFSYFSENMDAILTYLLLEHPKYSKLPEAEELWKIYQYEKERDNLLLRHFPLLNPIFHPLHMSGRSKTIDATADVILPAIIDMISTTFSNKNLVVQKKHADRELWKVFTAYIKYIKQIMEKKIGDKHALIRRHNVAARFHFTGRAVISPILGRHEGDEIHIPWNIGMMIMQPEIINLLVNREDFAPSEAIKYFYANINQYTDTLNKCFKALIRESLNGNGFHVLLNRNPTLIRESIRAVRVSKVKTNVHDKTINLPPRICKGFNADHDGDELNIFALKEQGFEIFISRMHPKEGILSETGLVISGWVKPTVETFIHCNQFLHYGREDTSPCEIDLPSDWKCS